MTKTSRYGLIVAGLFIFFIVAPILVLYVQGKTVSFTDQKPELTGIMSVKTNPSSANVKVGNQSPVKTPGAIRFLKAGDYGVTVYKEGYKTWQKRLNVIAGKVTYANPNPSPLRLLKDAKPSQIVSSANAYAYIDNRILYATDNMLVVLTPKSEQSLTVQISYSISSITPDPSGTYALLRGPQFVGIINTRTMEIVNLPKSTQSAISTSLRNGIIYSLDKTGTLNAFPATNPAASTVLASNISSFLVQGDEIYYLSAHTNALSHGSISKFAIVQEQTLATNIPKSDASTILIDSSKAVYLLLDSNLWRVNSKLELIEEHITHANTNSGTLVFTKPGELRWYDSGSNRSNLVTRITEEFSFFYVDPSLDYAFFIENHQIIALELDDRSGQNRYVLATSDKPISDLSLIDSSTLWYTIETNLFSLPVFDN